MKIQPAISIVMAYYNRLDLLTPTLSSIKHSKVKDIEIIIVDDASPIPISDEMAEFSDMTIRVIRVEPSEKWYVNPCVPFNMGIRAATGDIILLQNPECCHVGDVLHYIIQNLSSNAYLSFACYSLSEIESNRVKRGEYNLAHRISRLPQRTADGVGANNAWYNHSLIRPKGYHFAAAICKEDLLSMGGFDERYAKGSGYDDDELITRIRRKGMNIRIVDKPFVAHLFHRSNATHRAPLNKELFENVTLREDTWGV